MSLFHLPFRKEKAAENMASDMWLLSKAKNWEGPAFRRYGWTKREITFGYGQKVSWVEEQTGEVLGKLTRRPTGGGIVRHGTDLTYCMVLPRGSMGEKMPPMEFYGLIHQRWGEVLNEENIPNCLMPCPEKSSGGIPGDCFREPVGRDLMDGPGKRKLGGAAMKRTREGVLIQGTLELGEWPDLIHSQIEMRFLELICADLGESIEPRLWPSEFVAERMTLVKAYSSNRWTRERRITD